MSARAGRRAGGLRADVGAAALLTRPAQWPILTAQLAVGVLLAGPLAGNWPPAAGGPSLGILAGAWLSWVVGLNGGTLAFNGAYDRDTGPVAYLRRPPQPPVWLAGAALVLMGAGAVLGWVLVGARFGALTAGCVALSVLYSHPATRWKSRPGLDLLVNMAGYGAGTTAAGLAAGARAFPGPGSGPALADPTGAAAILTVCGFGLLFGALYPLTQIYQVDVDRQRGDRSLAVALGPRRSLGLALALTAGAWAAFGWGLLSADRAGHWPLPAAAGAAWTGHLIWCLIRSGDLGGRRGERAMYRALGLWALVDAGLVAAWLA